MVHALDAPKSVRTGEALLPRLRSDRVGKDGLPEVASCDTMWPSHRTPGGKAMENVGVRELKDHLARYLRAVRRGEIFTVTVRGTPVARLVPIFSKRKRALPLDLEMRMWELAGEGLLDWNGGSFQLPEPVAANRSGVLLSDLVVEDRE